MFKILKLCIICGPRIIKDYFSWMIKYSKHPSNYPIEERYQKARSLIAYVLKKMRLDLTILNYSELTNLKEKALIVGNHQSMIDIMLLITLSPQPITFVAKDTVRFFPFVGRILKSLEGEFLDRDDPRKSVEVLRRISKKLETNFSHVCIYPEGHRNKNIYEKLLPYHPGSFKPAFWNKSPILSFTEFGTFRIINLKMNYKAYPVWIEFNKLETFNQYGAYSTPEYAAKLEQQTNKNVKKYIELDNKYINQKRHLNKLTKEQDWSKKLK